MKIRQLIITSLFVAVTSGCMTSCSAPKAGDDDYMSWVRDYRSGMHVRHVQNDLTFDVQFQPSEYMWMQRNGDFNADAFDSQRSDLDGMQYFTLNIYSDDGKTDMITRRAAGDKDREKELLYYFSYRFQNDISVSDGTRQVPCTIFHYEQHGTKSFVLGFKKVATAIDGVTLIISSPLVDMDPVKIKVSTDS